VNETRSGPLDNWWESLIEKITDVPWGILAFLVIIVLMLSNLLSGEDLANAKALRPVAGLLGIGHGSIRDPSISFAS
jgi:hypothetical protein